MRSRSCCPSRILYLAVLIAAKEMGVRLRPELKVGESFQDEQLVEEAVPRKAVPMNDTPSAPCWLTAPGIAPAGVAAPRDHEVLADRYYGLESLALASLVERGRARPRSRSA